MPQPIPSWVHVGRLLGQFQPLLSSLALLQLTSTLTAFFSSLISFSSLSFFLESPPVLAFLCLLLFSSARHEIPSRTVVGDGRTMKVHDGLHGT